MKSTSILTEHCMICGRGLLYHERARKSSCYFCGRDEEVLILCPEGHFVCDTCHGAEILELLVKRAGTLSGETPEEILEELIALPRLPMHGPEHHPLAALALLLAERSGAPIDGDRIAEAIRRGLQIPGGSCGYLGGCGAGISLGLGVSLKLEATPLKGLERALANRASAEGLTAAGDGEPRCCKRALRRAVRVGREFWSRELGIDFPPAPRVCCRDHHRNRECPGASCPFYPAPAQVP